MSKRWESDTAASLSFDLGDWPGQRAGQHVDLRLTSEDGYQAQRSYSIASAPEDPGLALTVERLDGGEVSSYLVEEMAPGDELELRGPIGGWFNWAVEDGGPLLLVAGGSGIVPLMAMLRHRQRRGSHIPARLLVSVRAESGLFYAQELAALAAPGEGFELAVTLTGQASPAWRGYRGRIDQTMLAALAWPLEDRAQAFVCGPSSLVEAASGWLVEMGYPPQRVKAERFGPSRPEEAGAPAPSQANRGTAVQPDRG